jgi:hypothetical protein
MPAGVTGSGHTSSTAPSGVATATAAHGPNATVGTPAARSAAPSAPVRASNDSSSLRLRSASKPSPPPGLAVSG